MRVAGWQSKFWTYLETARSKEFVWGEHDCVLFSAGAADVILGTDYYGQIRTRYQYSTEAEAKALMDEHGGITGLVQLFLPTEPVNWGRLHVGDIIVTQPIPGATNTEALSVFDGHMLLLPAPRALAKIPLKYAIHGWRID